MNVTALSPPLWSTASFNDSDASLLMEQDVLGRHTEGCRGGHWLALRSGAERLHRFIASRFFTSLVAGSLLIGAGLLVL